MRRSYSAAGTFSLSLSRLDIEKPPGDIHRWRRTNLVVTGLWLLAFVQSPVGVPLGFVGADVGAGFGALLVGTGIAAVGVWVDVGAGVGGSGASVGTGVSVDGVCVGSDVASGLWESVGNGVVAALGTVVSVGVACGVSVGSAAGVTGLGNDVEPSAVAGTVAAAPPGIGVVSPQASRAARITRIADTAASVLLTLIRALTI